MKRILLILYLSVFVLTLASAQKSARGLKDAYKDYFKIGVSLNVRNLTPDQEQLILKEYNSVTCETAMNPGIIHPAEGKWSWEQADAIANFCRKNGIKMRGHSLLWHTQGADWMLYDKQGNFVKKEIFLARFKDHIQTIMKRYKDVIYCWDVVSEAIADTRRSTGSDQLVASNFREAVYYKYSKEKLGSEDEIIRYAFVYAREADPDALLFYNDYNETDLDKSSRIFNLIKRLKKQGTPIDGIGMQGHYNIYGPTMSAVAVAIEKYASIVDHIHITELDIRIQKTENLPIDQSVVSLHAYQYVQLFSTLRKYQDKIDCVSFWNLSDKDSWVGAANYPLLFDKDLKPKKVYDAVLNFESAFDNAVITDNQMSSAQEMTVRSMIHRERDLSARRQIRNDLNGEPCALIRVELPLEDVVFEGNIVGDVERHVNEYWVYLTAGSKNLEIKHPKLYTLDVFFPKYNISGVVGLQTYKLVVSAPQMADQGTKRINTSNGFKGNLENGHEYVDLGLPSGTLWATCNVGAENPEEFGDYFAWGETTEKSTCNFSTYKYCKGTYDSLTKYNKSSSYGTVDNKTVLDPEDDAAHVNWGGSWRMPTRSEQEELRDRNNCTWTWISQNGVAGYKVTSNKNSNSIFLPAAGCRSGMSLYHAGSYGSYWSSSLNPGTPDYAYYLGFSSNYVGRSDNGRYYGQSVRAVCATSE